MNESGKLPTKLTVVGGLDVIHILGQPQLIDSGFIQKCGVAEVMGHHD